MKQDVGDLIQQGTCSVPLQSLWVGVFCFLEVNTSDFPAVKQSDTQR